MRKRSLLVSIGVLALSLLTFGIALAQEGGDPERGAALYAENCVVCHGPQGEGRVGAELNDAFASVNVDAFLRQTIAEGHPGTFMTPWSEANGGPLSDEDIDDIVAYIDTWGKTTAPVLPQPQPPAEEIPPVPEVDGDPNQGAVVFAQNCAACHGEEGEGRIGQTLATEFASAEPGAYVIDVVTNGVEGALMPAFGAEQGGPLSKQEIQDVSAYVLSLQPVGVSAEEGDVVQPVSGLPLAIAAIAVLALLLGLGLLTQRQSSRRGQSE